MEKEIINENSNELDSLCSSVKELIEQKRFTECKKLISDAMGKYPHSPEPHNLMGVLLEKEDMHSLAMKHFRAAWALEPTYLPARFNLEQYSNLYSFLHKDYYTESDCLSEADTVKEKTEKFQIRYY